MNPYLKSTSLSPSTKFSSSLAQTTSTHPLTESTYYTPSNTINSNYSSYASRVDDQAHYRGGHGVSRTDFSASMGSRPVNLRSSHADFAPSSTTTATIYTVNTRPQGSGRSSSIEPGVSTFHDSTLRSDSYSKMYKPVGSGVTNAGIVHRPATLEQPEVKPSYTTTQRTAADHKANLEKLQAIIDAAKARQLASGIPRPEQDHGASNYASETRVYTPGVVGFSDTPTSYSSVGLEKTLSSQYKSVGYSGQALNYPSSADKYAVMRSSGIGGSLQPSKDVTSTSSLIGHTPAQSSTPLYSYSAGLSAKLDHVQPMSVTTPTLRQYESAISGAGAVNGGRLSHLSDESKGFSFRDPLSQEGRRLSGNASATSFGTVQAAPKEASSLNVHAQKANVIQSPPERLVRKEQNAAVDVPNLSSPLRRYQLEDRVYENGLLSATSESSISKKTFYSIEGSNNAALKAFKSTVAELSQRTPEKNKTTLADVQSPFEDLQFALNRDNVQISRIIIETVENYSSRESPYKRGGADSQRGEVEPPIIPLEPKKVIKPVNVVEEPRKASVSTVEETKKTPIIEPRQQEHYRPHQSTSPSGAEILKTYIKQPPLEEKTHSVAPQPTEQKKVTTSELSQFESGQKVFPSKTINETPKTELRPSVEHRKSSHHSQPVEEPSHSGHGVISQISTKVEHAKDHVKDHASSLLARIDSALARSQTSVDEGKQSSERRQSGASGLEQFETNREKAVTKTVHETPKTEPRPISESARPINIAQFEQPSRPVESESSRRESQKTEIKPSLSDVPKSNNQVHVDDSKSDLSRKLDLPLQYQEPRTALQTGNKVAEKELLKSEVAVEQPRKEVSAQGWQAQSEKESENRYVPSKDLSDKILDSRRESSIGADSRNDVNALTNQKMVGTMVGMNERLRSFEEFANQVEDQPAPVSDHRPTPSITNDEYKPSIANADVETISRADSRSDTFKSTAPVQETQKSKFVEQSVKSEHEEQEEEKSYPEPVTDFGASQNVITHREVLTKEPEPQLVSSKPESEPKKVVTPEVGTATEEVKKKSSNLAVKAMIGFLVLLLIGLLGMELVSGSGDA